MAGRSWWRTLTKVALGCVGLVAVLGGGGTGYLLLAKPVSKPASTEKVEATPERLARGTYLVEHLLPCLHCHSDHDTSHFGLPIAGGKGAGGLVFDRTLGLPGVIQPPNITPDAETGIGGISDGELMRAIREGIGRDGHALFPMMGYRAFRFMGDEDLRAAVSYLRTLPPVRRATKPIELDFPVGLMIRTVPTPVTAPVAVPDDARDHLGYGRYLVEMAGCRGCHTAINERGQALPGRDFAGGRVFPLSWRDGKLGPRVVTANITPDATGYFGHTSKAQWIVRVRGYAAIKDDLPLAAPGTNTLMPWVQYSGLTEQDLGAIYDYMQTVPKVSATVISFPDAPK